VITDFSFADNSIGYSIKGTMDKSTIMDLREQILKKFEVHDTINLYLEDNAIETFTLTAAAIGALFPLEYASRFDKIALVTDRKWIHVLASIDNILIKAHLQHFSKKERIAALEWISTIE